MNIRKAVKNAVTLKSLKQSTTTVTLSRRSGLYSTPIVTKNSKSLRKNGDGKQSTSIKCNIKNPTGVKRLNKRCKSSLNPKIEPIAEASTSGRFRRNCSRPLSEIGKENCWQNQDHLKSSLLIDRKRGRKQRAVIGHCSTDSVTDDVSSDSENVTNDLSRADTSKTSALVSEICGSCKPSTTCNCSFSSSNIDGDSGLKIDCVNYIECDSTTDNDRTRLPSTSILIPVS